LKTDEPDAMLCNVKSNMPPIILDYPSDHNAQRKIITIMPKMKFVPVSFVLAPFVCKLALGFVLLVDPLPVWSGWPAGTIVV